MNAPVFAGTDIVTRIPNFEASSILPGIDVRRETPSPADLLQNAVRFDDPTSPLKSVDAEDYFNDRSSCHVCLSSDRTRGSAKLSIMRLTQEKMTRTARTSQAG